MTGLLPVLDMTHKKMAKERLRAIKRLLNLGPEGYEPADRRKSKSAQRKPKRSVMSIPEMELHDYEQGISRAVIM